MHLKSANIVFNFWYIFAINSSLKLPYKKLHPYSCRGHITIYFLFLIFMTQNFEVLSTHKCKATYTGIEHIPCMFRTALCPDRCGHARDCAKFHVDEYVEYELKGKYGDEKQEDVLFNINPRAEEDPQDPQIIEKIKALKPGDHVLLYWEHIYANHNGMHTPERPIRSIEKI